MAMRGMRGSRIDQDRRDDAYDRAVRRANTVYWLAVRFYPNGEAKRLQYFSALERGLAVISLTAAGTEIIGQGEEGVADGKA